MEITMEALRHGKGVSRCVQESGAAGRTSGAYVGSGSDEGGGKPEKRPHQNLYPQQTVDS